MVDTTNRKKTTTRKPRTKKNVEEAPAVAKEPIPQAEQEEGGAIIKAVESSPVPEESPPPLSATLETTAIRTKLLTEEEHQRKQELEERVRTSFREGFRALAEIRDKRLYRDEFDTFEDYVNNKFSFSARRAYYLLDSVQIVEVLEAELLEENESSEQIVHNSIPLPEKESQCRPLKNVPNEKIVEVWKKAVALAGNSQPTAREVALAKNDVLGDSPSAPVLALAVGDICRVVGEDSTLQGERGRLGIVKARSDEGLTIEFSHGLHDGVNDRIIEKVYSSDKPRSGYKVMHDFLLSLAALPDARQLDGTAALLVDRFSRLKKLPTDLEQKLLKTLTTYYAQQAKKNEKSPSS